MLIQVTDINISIHTLVTGSLTPVSLKIENDRWGGPSVMVWNGFTRGRTLHRPGVAADYSPIP